MIITRTPYRISFFGGGTDYRSWCAAHGGAVLATTIDKYCYLTVRYLPPFFEHRFRIVYRKTETCNTVEEIEHPAVRAVLQHLGIDRGLEVHHDGDLPARSGLGTSSAFTVGFLHALHALEGRMVCKHDLARESIHIEQDVLSEVVGSQDQVSAAYGGLNHIVFLPNGEIAVRPVTVSLERMEELRSHLMLFYTGIQRTASSVAPSYVDHLDEKAGRLYRIGAFVDEGIRALSSDEDIAAFGRLLHEAWRVKRELSDKVSTARVDDMYQAARDAGAIGGKLTGAGGGGFMVLFVPPAQHLKVRDVFRDLIYVPIDLDSSGSQVVFYDPDEGYESLDRLRRSQALKPFEENQALL